MPKKNYRTLASNGAVEHFGTRRETEARAQVLADETGDWVGVEHFDKADPNEPFSEDAWSLIDVKNPAGADRPTVELPLPDEQVEQVRSLLDDSTVPFSSLQIIAEHLLKMAPEVLYAALDTLRRQGRADIRHGFGWYRTTDKEQITHG